MSPEQQRVALSKALGNLNPRIENGRVIRSAFQDSDGKFYGSGGVAEYSKDLNAMAEIRNKLVNTPELRIKWVNTLRDVVGLTCTRRNKAGQAQVSDIDLLFASPEQLCEALVKTLNLWIK